MIALLYLIFLLPLFLILIIMIILAIILGLRVKTKPSPLDLRGKTCIALEDVTPINFGWVRIRGELWKAKSINSIIRRGERAVVIKVLDDHLIIEKTPGALSRPFE